MVPPSTRKILKSQKGISIIVVVAFSAILLGSLIVLASALFNRMLVSLNRQRNRVVALQVLQDFAVLAQKANDSWVNNGAAACPAGYTQLPAGRPFCWSNTPNTDCIRDTHDSALANGVPLCFNVVAPPTVQMNVAALTLLPPAMNYWQKMGFTFASALRQRHEILARLEGEFLAHTATWFNSSAVAQTAQAIYDPPLAGAGWPPTAAKITANACPGAAPWCKTCNNVTFPCVELQVCTNPAGCGAINSGNWLRETLGIIPR